MRSNLTCDSYDFFAAKAVFRCGGVDSRIGHESTPTTGGFLVPRWDLLRRMKCSDELKNVTVILESR